MSSIADILGNAASGGLLGVIGTIGGEVIGFFKRKQEHSQWLDKAKLQGELDAAKTAGELAVSREKGASEAFAASQVAEGNLKGEHRWVTSFRAFTRPGLTWTSLLASIIFGFFPPSSQMGMEVVAMLNVYTGMMIAWWFGQRAMDRAVTSWSGGGINGKVSGK